MLLPAGGPWGRTEAVAWCVYTPGSGEVVPLTVSALDILYSSGLCCGLLMTKLGGYFFLSWPLFLN